jgi:hypothetical protein
MPTTENSSTTNAPKGECQASPTVRSVISYLLFLHFFILAVGIKSNTSSSGLDQDLRNKVPGVKPYLQLLGMDLSYMFHLTYYNGRQNLQDTDYVIEADVPQSDGTTRQIVVQSASSLPPIRDYRYRRLAFTAANAAESGNDSLSSLLPQAVARRLMLENHCRQVTIRVRRRLLQNLMLPDEDPQAAVERSRSPDDPAYFANVYEARAFLTSDGEVDVAPIKASFDTAAPAGSPPPPAAPSATPTGTKS